jgi:hypothetical protein
MAPTVSFEDFATQFVKVRLPTALATVASAIGSDKKPISLRAMMDTAAPYVPDITRAAFVDNSQSTPPNWRVVFLWTDLANLPPWDSSGWSGPPPNPARAATSWQFTVWPAGGSPVIDATVPVANEKPGGGVQYEYNGALVGDFEYRITAFNEYGSASTGTRPITIILGAPVPAPPFGLASNYNYILASNGNPLRGLAVTINVTQDISCPQGFSFQLNAASPTGKTIATQQYVIALFGTDISWLVNLNSAPSGGGSGLETLIAAGTATLRALASSKIPAGYQLQIAPQNTARDAEGKINEVLFAVTDNLGNREQALITLTSLPDPAKATDLAPIVAFELNLVGPDNGAAVVLSSGSGSIVYEASSPLTVSNAWPPGAGGGETVETANSVYGALSAGPGSLLSQTFTVSTK